MARTLLKEGLDVAWDASCEAYRRGENAMEQLRAGIRAYLDYVSDRRYHVQRQQAEVDQQQDKKDSQ